MRHRMTVRGLMVSGMRSYPSMMAGELAPYSMVDFSSRMFAKFERNKPHLNVGTIGKFFKALELCAIIAYAFTVKLYRPHRSR